MRLHHNYIALSLIAALSASNAAQEGNLLGPPAPDVQAAQISEYVRKVFQDRDGNFWFGTNGDGVCRYDGKSLTYLSVEEGFGGRAVRGILQDDGGVMWFATDGGVSRYEGGVFTNYTVANGLSDNQVWSMMRDRAGTIWVGTQVGVCRYDGKSFVPFPIPRAEVENPESRFTPNVVWGMVEDRDGNIWFGTDGEGARKYDGKSFTTYTTKNGLAGNNVRCIFADRRGRIWLGTDGGGVSRFDGTSFECFTTKDGLNNDRVFVILEDKAGDIWFSTVGAGACRYDGKSFTVFGESSGLTRSHVQSIFEDKDGTLWFGCSGGLFRFDGKSFVNVSRNGPWPAPVQRPAPAKVADPMAGFARMVGGEWKMTAQAGTSMFDIWHWGPGKHSLRVMTDGFGADGKPWRALQAVYWYPGRKQVRSLGLSPYRAGVAEGTIKFTGEALEAITDMYQTGDHRNLKSRWKFVGPDEYHEELLESTGLDDYFLLTAWDRFRVAPPTTPRLRAVEGAKLPEHLKAFEPFLAHTWETLGETKGEWVTGVSFHIQSTFEWVPLANGIYMRTLAPTKDGEPTHLLDAYLYHHTGANVLRCLALSNRGGVYEGDLTVLDNGALQLELMGYEGDRVVPHVARLDFEPDGILRHRVWSLEGAERTLMLDAYHKKIEPKKD